MALTLYFVPRTRSTRPRWLLEEAGATYELVRLDAAKGETRTPEYLAIHPLGKVPALVDDGVPFFESAALVMHLADKFSDKGLAPKPGTDERGHYYQWILFCMASVEPHLGRLMKLKGETGAQEAAIEAERASAREHLAVLEKALGGREFIVGNAFTAADVVVASTLAWARVLGALDGFAACDAYLTRCLARPASKRARAV